MDYLHLNQKCVNMNILRNKLVNIIKMGVSLKKDIGKVILDINLINYILHRSIPKAHKIKVKCFYVSAYL